MTDWEDFWVQAFISACGIRSLYCTLRLGPPAQGMWPTASVAAPAGLSIPVASTIATKNEVEAADIFKPPGRWAECSK